MRTQFGTAERRARLKPDPEEAGRRTSTQGDVQILVTALAAAEIKALAEDVYQAWRRHSETHAASWLVIYPDDESNRQALLPHLELDD